MSSTLSKKKDWYNTGRADAIIANSGKTGFILNETLQMLQTYDDPDVIARYLAGFKSVNDFYTTETNNGNS